MTTQKDYRAIALCFVEVARRAAVSETEHWTSTEASAAERMRAALAKELALQFKHDNPRFDEARFLEACEVAS